MWITAALNLLRQILHVPCFFPFYNIETVSSTRRKSNKEDFLKKLVLASHSFALRLK